MKTMKIVNRNIFEFQEDKYLFAIRDKVDYIKLVLVAAEMLSVNEKFKKNGSDCYLKLKIGRMGRIFVFKEDKFFSFGFPFNVQLKNQSVIKITTYSGLTVDSQTISSALSLLTGASNIIQAITTESSEETFYFDSLGKRLLEELIMAEPGYLRYDKDILNTKGKKHPTYHLDFNFSSYGTYKLGLLKDMLTDEFEDMTNIETDCFFLHV